MTKKELVFIGPPASGKGTQTNRLSIETGLPHIDTGSLLRAAIANKTEDGLLAKTFIDKGQLVPIQVVTNIIKNALLADDCKNGFILDGFPRNMEQAESLENILSEVNKNDKNYDFKVIFFDKPFNTLLKRIINRRSCPKCGEIYNLETIPPKVANVCDKCGAELVQRKDDTEEVASKRFETYNKETFPLIAYYKEKGSLVTIDADGNPDEVYKNLINII